METMRKTAALLKAAILEREKVELAGIQKLHDIDRLFIYLEMIGLTLMVGSIFALVF